MLLVLPQSVPLTPPPRRCSAQGQRNYFEPAEPAPAEAPAAASEAEEGGAPPGGGSFPAEDPSGTSVLQKSLLPFDDHPYAQSQRANPRRQPGAMMPELERRVTAERRGRGGGSAQTSSLGPSHTMRGFYDHMPVEKGCFPEPVTGYGGFQATTNLISK